MDISSFLFIYQNSPIFGWEAKMLPNRTCTSFQREELCSTSSHTRSQKSCGINKQYNMYSNLLRLHNYTCVDNKIRMRNSHVYYRDSQLIHYRDCDSEFVSRYSHYRPGLLSVQLCTDAFAVYICGCHISQWFYILPVHRDTGPISSLSAL